LSRLTAFPEVTPAPVQ